MNELPTGQDLFAMLPEMAAKWHEHLASRCEPVLRLADSYGALVSRAVRAMGLTPPESRQDSIVRDLIADVFDFLYEWPRPLLEGRVNVAWPLGRRAFESLCLACACYQDPVLAAKWDKGAQIGNAEIRRALAKAPFSESEAAMKDFYNAFSAGSHPNRGLIGERFLGDGNQYVLGSMGEPEFVIVLEHCCRLLDMWCWFGAFVGHVARNALDATDPTFGQDYLEVATRAAEAKKWAVENYNGLLAERQAELKAQGYAL